MAYGLWLIAYREVEVQQQAKPLSALNFSIIARCLSPRSLHGIVKPGSELASGIAP